MEVSIIPCIPVAMVSIKDSIAIIFHFTFQRCMKMVQGGHHRYYII